MAVYFLHLKTFGRSDGSSAPSAAAYRAGERIKDERTGRTYDHTDRQDVLHKEILLPSRFADADIDWARDRARLWNAAEDAETRKNARVAREYLVALPVELSPSERIGLVRGFSQELSDRYRFAVDIAIHAPRDFPGSDPRNFHAHLLATTREVTTAGLAAKTTLELNDSKRRELGLDPVIYELLHVRERWAMVTNEALRSAHSSARVDHRTLEAQGIDREPRPRIPRAAFEMERHGYRSFVAERLRADYEARVQLRLEQAAAQRPLERAQQPAGETAGRPTLEEIRRQARESWLKLRKEAAEGPARSAMEKLRDDDLGRDYDLGR
jgi:ATP-dependent exoDNAse (exonuclease V) alpha subunit